MKRIAVFDFDGTLTTRDTMLEFIKFSRGTTMLILGLLIYSPVLVLMKIGVYPNWKAKQLLFSFYFRGYPYEIFHRLGEAFKSKIEQFSNEDTLNLVRSHISNGDKVYVITASIEEWVSPWCNSIGIANVVGTQIEVHDGKLTGGFLSRNCYGIEKVNRLLEREPDRQTYTLFAYGNSKGDREIIEYADKGVYV